MENNAGSNESDLSSYKRKQIEFIATEEERRQKWRKEIAENSALQDYLQQFSTDSVNKFIEHLLAEKNTWLEHGEQNLEDMNNEGDEWVEQAKDHLQIIQQKKLFDTQCLWRAEKMTIEGIETCYDLEYWGHNILNCPFIEPVSEEEIAWYTEYLQTEDAELEYDHWWCWQEYDELKEAFEDDDSDADFPEWYDFENRRSGKDALLMLPDIRGKKEAFYYSLAAKTEQSRQPKNEPEKPTLHYSRDNFMQWYVQKFETRQIKKFYKAFKWSMRSRDKEEALQDDLTLLFEANEKIPVDANEDWMEAIKNAAEKYRRFKIAEALPIAWQQYMFKIEAGISFSGTGFTYSLFQQLRSELIQKLIKGRILNGEPGDLNF